jgi:hypothetical protein
VLVLVGGLDDFTVLVLLCRVLPGVGLGLVGQYLPFV